MLHTFTATVDAGTAEQAEQVMAERLTHDEDYGYPYTVTWGTLAAVVAVGNPRDGFRYVGPFPDANAATEWAEQYVTDEWWTFYLDAPAES